MGQHSVPRFYLSGFAPPGENRIWTYDKKSDGPRLLPIKSVAQRKHQYGDIEEFLTKDIEAPAKVALTKIRTQEAITGSDKLSLSKYIFILAKRVEAAFKRFREKSPEIAASETKRLDKSLSDYASRNPDKAARCEEIRKNVPRIMNDLAENPTREIWANSLLHGNERMPGIISKMTWTFYVCTRPDLFITNDNPVFIHRSLGIGKWYSDLSFPVSGDVSVLASWLRRRDLEYRQATPQQIRELNRRMAVNTTRFAFGPSNKSWITDLLNKPKHEVHLWIAQFPYKNC